jgi:D-3-phosphoglycerate dehydrogenase
MARPRIVVPDDHPTVFAASSAAEMLRAFADVRIVTDAGAEREDELIRRVGDAEGAINIRAYAKYTDRVIAACPKLRVISIWGTGTDNVDLIACEKRGVTVLNTPGVNAHAVAEHSIALMLSVLRRIPSMNAELRGGAWARAPLAQLEGKTVGIVGLGAIGSRVATLASAFGARLLAYTSTPDNGRAAAVGATPVPIETLLRESDVVSLHLRLDDATRGFLSRERIVAMKRGAWLVNTSRGALVDRTALIDALRSGTLSGAGLDVFHDEPVAKGDELVALPNVVVTPHVAGNTPEVIAAGLARAVENLREFYRIAPR